MNSLKSSNWFAPMARIITALAAAFFLIPAVPAQPMAGGTDSRYLLIFETSSAMKKRVPAMQTAVERLFFAMMNGQLQAGDSIGAWAYDRQLHAGDVPLQHWAPQSAATIASNINNFVKHQPYSKSARFDVVMPGVNSLVRNSERLTVLMFCDGEGEIKGTPYDNAINDIFKQHQAELRKADQTFIVVLRAQLGQYIGYMVGSSAMGVTFPNFLPLRQPPTPMVPVNTNLPPPPPPPVIQAPPLVIIGTNVGTNLISLIPPPLAPTNPPPIKMESNPPPPVESLSNPTNVIPTNTAALGIAETQTNAPAPPEDNPGLTRNGAMKIGVGLLAAAVVLIIFALFRSRKTGRGSLITRSMKKD